MEYFWDIVETINHKICPGFVHFHWQHILWLIIFLAFISVSSAIFRRLPSCSNCGILASDKINNPCTAPLCRKHIKLFFAIFLVADALFKHFIVLINGVSILNYLPLQLCYISVIIAIIHSFTNKGSQLDKYLGNFLYLVGLPAGLSALLFPSWTALPAFANAMSIHSFSSHIILVTYVVMLLVGGEIKPDNKTIPISVLFLIILSIVVYFFDSVFDLNYMYLLHISAGSPLYPFESLGDYRIGYAIILAILILLMYVLPSIVKKALHKSRRPNT